MMVADARIGNDKADGRKYLHPNMSGGGCDVMSCAAYGDKLNGIQAERNNRQILE